MGFYNLVNNNMVVTKAVATVTMVVKDCRPVVPVPSDFCGNGFINIKSFGLM
jgi:hypothetical protein